MNVSEQLLHILSNCGVTNVYGVTGDALNVFVKAVESSEQVHWRAFKHEGNAAFAAFGESESTGNLAVCAGTVGPGALHLINGLYNAKKARTPVVAITGQIPRMVQGTNYFQEVDLKKVYDDVCAYQAIIRTPEEAPLVIQRAIKIALADRAVVRIELPADVAELEAKNQHLVHPIVRSEATLVPSNGQLEQTAKLLNGKTRVGILAGHGCRQARAEVLAISERLNAPITYTTKASDIFHRGTKNAVGLTGLIGNPSGYKAVMDCDVLLMLATDFPYMDFLPHETVTIQVDVRPENIGNRTAVTLGVHSDVGAFCEGLLPLLEPNPDTAFLDALTLRFQRYIEQQAKAASPERDGEPLHPQIFAGFLDKHASDDALFTVETGTSAIWAMNHISYHSDRRVFGSFNHGSMAVGLPAAMGAQFAHPGREVWSISGDGAFNMAMNDFITAVRYELPVKILVLNNGELSFVKLEMEQVGLAPALDALAQTNINFADFARLCGGDGVRVEHAEDIEAAVLKAKHSDKPFIIDAVVTSGELSLPPKITLDKAKGFGLSKLRELGHAITGDQAQWKNLKKELDAWFD